MASQPKVLDRLSVDLVAVTRDGVGLALDRGPPPKFVAVSGCRPDEVRVAADVADAGILLTTATHAPGDDEEEGDALDDDENDS